jgi:hypothetical protein
MKRLSIATCVLLALNLSTYGIKLLLASGLPMANLWAYALIGLAMVALVYFATLEASPLYYLYHREFKVYALAASFGIVLGFF